MCVCIVLYNMFFLLGLCKGSEEQKYPMLRSVDANVLLF
jgi:hypothetical protein